MKKLLLLLTFLSFNSYSQYSNYYVNQNVDLDVTGRVNINKTIKNIDYGALAQANAQYERNRLERAKYENEEPYCLYSRFNSGFLIYPLVINGFKL